MRCRCSPLPRCCRLMLLFAAVLLIISSRCCHADEPPVEEDPAPEPNAADGPVNMANFVCAKKDTQHSGFTQLDESIAMNSEGIGADTSLFVFLKNKNEGKLTINMAVDEKCKDTFQMHVNFPVEGGEACAKEEISEEAPPCPEDVPNCKFFKLTCSVQMREVAGYPEAGAFKAKLRNVAELKKVCPWKGFVKGAVLVLADSSEAGGEACVGGFPWLIVGIAAGVVVLLIVVIVVICVIRARNQPQPSGGASALQILSTWSSFGRKSTAGTMPLVGRTKAERSGVAVPGTMMSGVSKMGGTKMAGTTKMGLTATTAGGGMTAKGTTMAGTKAATTMAGTKTAGTFATQKKSSGAYGIL